MAISRNAYSLNALPDFPEFAQKVRYGVPGILEQIDKLALTFELTYRLAHVSENETAPRLEPTLTVKGNCFYNPTTKEVSNVLMNAEVFTWRDITGQDFTNTNHYVYASGSIVLGGLTTVAHTLKEPVE